LVKVLLVETHYLVGLSEATVKVAGGGGASAVGTNEVNNYFWLVTGGAGTSIKHHRYFGYLRWWRWRW
jgi:hypothetical protein